MSNPSVIVLPAEPGAPEIIEVFSDDGDIEIISGMTVIHIEGGDTDAEEKEHQYCSQ